MIKVRNLVPNVYYDQSRDFQLIGRLYEIVFNYLKTNIDSINNSSLNNNSDKELLELLSMTLGFKSKHNYSLNQLYAICSCFSEVLRYKGTKRSIEIAVNALLQSEGIRYSCNVVIKDNNIYIYTPALLKDTNLIYDLFDYILPAGMSCQVLSATLSDSQATTTLTTSDNLKILSHNSYDLSQLVDYQNNVKLSDVAKGRRDDSTILQYESFEEEKNKNQKGD